MAQPKTKGPAPFSLRMTAEERLDLERRAGRQPLGAYIRERLFERQTTPRRCRGQGVVKDHKALSQVLGLLGRSRLAATMNQLARAADVGALPVSPEVETSLRDACKDVAAIKALVMRALGIQER